MNEQPRRRRTFRSRLGTLGLRHAAADRIVPAAYYLLARRGFRSDQELADVLGIGWDEFGRWKRGKSLGSDDERLLRDLAITVSELLTVYEPAAVPEWLQARAPGELKTPLEWLREGNLAEVLNLINASATGAYS